MLGIEGQGIRSAFVIATDELVKSGFVDEEQAKEQRAQLAAAIMEMG